ncbi:hypothetical protein D1013_17690 [Euzebyella marina]|uniref:Putative beta-lactamase-inhibitor-like PepSY-like domain-containing protein n=2 Tax=Euzebyella marina TaxID=1761453 RepID=A0A3G2LA09_9FLAO|nr:hypothetical protein D1013_17690 [Euzebyella marina]
MVMNIKNFFWGLSLLALSIVSCSDDDDINANEVPQAVDATFNQTFPNATDIEWEAKNNKYEVEFDIETIDHKALIASDGSIEQYKYDIVATELPAEVTSKLSTDYPNNRLDDSEVLKIGTQTYYQVELENEPQDIYLVFQEDGEINSEVTYFQ